LNARITFYEKINANSPDGAVDEAAASVGVRRAAEWRETRASHTHSGTATMID